ncbi:MAG TPA: GDP-mannose 4,6-dehydratase [Candidatus Ratteibacteria bacterium]|nr:GDP-mannose 4,6-dehydratase [Candidatus Ratteibacteria bacterium]
MKYLITGGAGFIGSHIVEELLKRNSEIFVLDDLSTGSLLNVKDFLKNENFHIFIDTILNEHITAELVRRSDFVFHLASVVGVKRVMENPIDSLIINILGTHNVLKSCVKYNKKVLITSTSEIYGKNKNVPFNEETDIVIGSTKKKRWSYACSKAIDEFLAFAYNEEQNLSVIIVRLFNTVGSRQTDKYGMVIPKFVKQALKNEVITVFGDGNQTRCFISVKDVVETLLKLIEKKEAYGDVFNVGSDEEVKIKDLSFKIKEITGSKSEIKFISPEKIYTSGFEDMERRVPDTSKIKKIIDFKIKYSLEDIIKDVVNYYKNQ